MKTFTSLYDLDKLSDDDPAKPVVKQLLEWLIADGEFPNHPYNPEEHGYIALVEPDDVVRELADIDMPRLTEIMWEGVSILDGFYHAVYLGAGDYGIGFVIPVDARVLPSRNVLVSPVVLGLPTTILITISRRLLFGHAVNHQKGPVCVPNRTCRRTVIMAGMQCRLSVL